MSFATKRVLISLTLFALSLIFGFVAARSVLGHIWGFFPHSLRSNEIAIDATGIAASVLGLAAGYVAYPLRKAAWIRLYLSFVFLVSLAFTFEFGVGFLWFAFDRFRPFGYHA